MALTFNLAGKTALVTGSTKGIGYAIAALFARAGATPLIHGSTPETVKAAVEKLEKDGAEAFGYHADIRDADSIRTLVEQASAKHGAIDILVNNAGISAPSAPIESLTEKDWNDVISINLTAPFLFAKHVIPSMKRRNSGVILNIGSEGYVYGSRSSSVAYTASKGGLVSLTKGLVREVEGFNIRINAISPWHVRTEKLLTMLSGRTPQQQEQFFTEHNMLHSTCLPIDVANAALFLSSDYARFIHGEILHINGGAGYL